MRRFLCICIVLIITCSFVGFCSCSNRDTTIPDPNLSSDDPSQPSTDNQLSYEQLLDSKPNEYLLEKVEAGIPVLIAFASAADNYFCREQLGAGIEDYVSDLGFEFQFLSAEVDTALQISQIENFIEMGAAIIVALPMDASTIKDITLTAEEKGTSVIIYGVEADFGICATQNMEEIGKQMAAMAIAWMDTIYPDASEHSVKTCIFGQTAVTDLIIRTESIKNSISDDERVNIVYEAEIEDVIDVGFNRMEEAFTFDPEIKLVFATSASGSVGCNNYILSQNIDTSDIGLFCCDYDSVLEEMLNASAAGRGIIRGSIIASKEPASGVISCISGIINGTISSPYIYYHPLYAMVAPDFDYQYSSEENIA